MKKVLSVLLSVMLFMMMFQGIQIFAAVDNSYAYVLSEQTPNYNDVTATVSEDGAYVSLVTTGDDSWFALDGLNIPSEYKILAMQEKKKIGNPVLRISDSLRVKRTHKPMMRNIVQITL